MVVFARARSAIERQHSALPRAKAKWDLSTANRLRLWERVGWWFGDADHVNLRQLEYFLAVAETGSFTAAAHQVHVTQPSLSQQIKALEAELGGELFDRASRAVTLTAAGRAFVADARQSVVSAASAGESARRALRFETGELKIVTVRSLAVALLPETICRWHKRCPDMSVHLREFPHPLLVERAVREGVGALGIGPRPHTWDGPLEPLGWDEFVLMLPPADPLTSVPGPVKLHTLADRGWVTFGPPTGLASFTAQACWRAEFEPRAVVETAEVTAAIQLVSAGLGPALVPINSVPHDLTACVRQLDPPIVWPVAAFARDSWAPPVPRLIEVLREGHLRDSCPPDAWVLEHGRDATPVTA